MFNRDAFLSGQQNSSGALIDLQHGRLLASMTAYGARIVALETPDRTGTPIDVVLGYAKLHEYRDDRSTYHGASIGRFANRIARGTFTLDSKTYTLERNENRNTLHGGSLGFDACLWEVTNETARSVTFRHFSRAGDQGFPGTLDVEVTFLLTDANSLRIDYCATTDAPTVVNFTNHAYFNLSGHNAGSVLDHTLWLDSDAFTPVDDLLIPTGELRPVQGTPFDFRVPRTIGRHIADRDRQLEIGSGYDHNFALTGGMTILPRAIARLHSPASGITMTVSTTEPGLQLYSGNQLDGSHRGKAGLPYERHAGVCLETQHFPDSPNRAEFPSTVLRPGTAFRSTTIYAFVV